MINYRENLKEYLGINLLDIGWTSPVDQEKVDSCTDEEMLARLDEYAPDGFISLADAEKHSLDDFIEADALPFFNKYAVEDALEELVKEAKHYLVMAHNCRWNGASGYTIVDSVWGTLSRDCEVTIVPHSVSKGGKTLCCTEYSHDVPMGGKTSIIALTDREYEFLNHWDTSFEAVERFAAECESRMG